MYELNTSLLREKFLIHDTDPASDAMGSTLQALSNRIVIELKTTQGETQEIFAIRGQNMHCCVRFAARIIKAYETRGALMKREPGYDWDDAWNSIVNDYEYEFNPERWIAIYHKGQCVFSAGERNLFLDVIEKCDARNTGVYDDSIQMAEEAFQKAGKQVKIDHEANVALVLDLKKMQGRIGVIMRGPTRTTTFNFSIASKMKQPINFAQCLAAASCFLEGIQLAFMLGMNTEKIRIGLIERFTKEEKQTKAAGRRLARMNAEIANLENAYEVHYRPERPEFQHIVMEAEKLAQKILVPPEEEEEEEEEGNNTTQDQQSSEDTQPSSELPSS